MCFPVPAELHLIQHGEQLLMSTLSVEPPGWKEGERTLIQRDLSIVSYLVSQARPMSASGSGFQHLMYARKKTRHDCVTG